MKLVWTAWAKRDLEEIGDFIAMDDPEAARRHVQRLRDRMKQAAAVPGIGRVVPESRDPSIREVVEGNYRLVYRVTTKHVEAVAIREAHRLLTLPD